MLGGLGLLVWNDALGRREADPVACATPRFRGYFQTWLLSAGHLMSLPLEIRSHLRRAVKRVHQRVGLRSDGLD